MAESTPDGTVYTETVIYSPPEQYASDAPYQIAIIDINGGGRHTVRIIAPSPDDRARIGDRVTFVENRGGVAYYRKSNATATETPRPLV